MRHVLVTAARNEQAFISETLTSVSQQILSLPTFQELGDDRLDYVANKLKEFGLRHRAG